MSEISELKDAIEAKGKIWEDLKAKVDKLEAEKAEGKTDPLLVETIAKMDNALNEQSEIKRTLEARMTAMENKIARGEFAGATNLLLIR